MIDHILSASFVDAVARFGGSSRQLARLRAMASAGVDAEQFEPVVERQVREPETTVQNLRSDAGSSPSGGGRYASTDEGRFRPQELPRQAVTAEGGIDVAVWSGAMNLYLSTIDPDTGSPYSDRPLVVSARAAVQSTASSSRAQAIKLSAETDEKAAMQEKQAAKHLRNAADEIEQISGILDEPVIGPDGGVTDARQIYLVHQQDLELARRRSAEGNSRHTQQNWKATWRLLAVSFLGIMDATLLWAPLLNLTFEGSPDNMFRWAIALGMVSLQVLAIEWSVRSFIGAERSSVDRREAAVDYNRPFKSGGTGRWPAPTVDDILDADRNFADAYRLLVCIAAAIGVLGGVRIAWLARQADLPIYEAGIFAVVVGLVWYAWVWQLAQLFCRGNLLGDRLWVEREVIDEISGRIRKAQGKIAEEREKASSALAESDSLATEAQSMRHRIMAENWRAVELGWAWLGLPLEDLNRDDFEREALPSVEEASLKARDELIRRLDRVNAWLSNRTAIFTANATNALNSPEIADTTESNQKFPLRSELGGRAVTFSALQPLEVPEKPAAPYQWMLSGVTLIIGATALAAFFARAM